MHRGQWSVVVGFAGGLVVNFLSVQPVGAIYLDDERTLFLTGVFYN